MISKIQLAVLCVFVLVISGLSVAVSSLRHERSLLLLEIERMNTELALSSQSLMQSNEAIARQNAEIKRLKTESAEQLAGTANKLKLINDKYAALKKNADERLNAAPSCDTQLDVILSQQRQFLEGTP